MSQQTTVRTLAALVNTPVERLMEQLSEAGIVVGSPDQAVTSAEKYKLFGFLRQTHGKGQKREDLAEAHNEAISEAGKSFLRALGNVSVTELAALRGVSRQYAYRDWDKFLASREALNALYRTLLVIDTDSSRATAERLKKYASEELRIHISVGSAVSVAGSKTFSQLFSEHRELWILSSSPLDSERTEYFETLCTEFMDKDGRLLVYFVPSLEVADRLAARFETELLGRQYDADGNELKGAEGFRANLFIVVTDLVAALPYVIIANPGSANLAMEGVPPSSWVLGKQAQDLFEVSSRFGDQLIQKARAAGLGVSRNPDNFFPLGQPLRKESGIPFWTYPNVDPLIGIRLEHSVGLFDGEPVDSQSKATESNNDNQDDHEANERRQHPLKFYPTFIRAYRKKAGELSKRKPPLKTKRQYFKF